MRLYIASGTHVDNNIEDRICSIEANIGAPNVVFYEGDRSNFSKPAIRNNLSILPVAPPFAAAVWIQIYLFVEIFGRIVSTIGGNSSGRDQDVVDKLKEKYDIDTIEVDMDLTKFVHENWLLFGGMNWIIGALIVVYFFPFQPFSVELTKALLYILLAGYMILIAFLGVVHKPRNRHFANVIIEHSGEYNKASLVTGGAHHAAVGLILHNETEIDVMNPVPENPSIFTRWSLAVLKNIQNVKSFLNDS